MTLENLLKIGQLKEHAPDTDEIRRLIAAAERSLADARVTAISAETRFDAAYKAIMQTALAALMAHGYRPDTKRPGHHVAVVQGLPLTIGLAAPRVMVLDTLRRQRNVSDYTGEDVDDSSAEHCIAEACRGVCVGSAGEIGRSPNDLSSIGREPYDRGERVRAEQTFQLRTPIFVELPGSARLSQHCRMAPPRLLPV